MQSWLGAGSVGTVLWVASGGGREERARSFLAGAGGDWETVLQESSGDVGGMVLAGVALVALGLAGVAVWRTGVASLLDSGQDSDAGPTTVDSESAADPETDTESPATPAEPEPESAEPSEPELTDREVIIDILGDHEGRMKQAKIVDETGWSKSKVSMLLSDMEENGDISKLRVGRENIVSLSGNEPEAAGSPFEDE